MDNTERTIAIIVAAGSGTRAGGDAPKQFRRVGGQSLIAHAYHAFADHLLVDEVLIVVAPGAEAEARDALGVEVATVAGGAAEAAAVALVNGRDPDAAARAAAPGWPRERVHVHVRGGRVSVRLESPAVLQALPAPVHVSASAVVRRPRE